MLTLLILVIYFVVFDLHHLKFFLLTIHNPIEKHEKFSLSLSFITLSAALECNGTPSSYFPVNKPQAKGDQVIVPIPRRRKFEFFFYLKIFLIFFSNQFYDKFLVDELQLYHVEINDIQLVHISVGLN